MKLQQKEIQVKTSKFSTEYGFHVGDPGMIFSILREKLYSNIKATIVREVACNARDAHREVGKFDLPIEITVPSKLDSNLRIKDYGPGISPERMESIYCAFGKSTKREDNVQTGGFGIGAKTPFAYTNRFTIITTTPEKKNNKTVHIKRSYIAYIDETRVGKVILLTAEEVNEPCGTEIVVDIKKEDIQDFKEAIVSTTRFWPIKPIIHGDLNYPEEKEKPLIKTDDWCFYTESVNYNYNNGNLAIIDGVAYNLNFQNISNLPKWCKILNYHTNYIHLYFNTGDLSLSASREELQYDEITQKNLLKVINNIPNEIINHLNNEIKNLSYIDAATMIKSLYYIFGDILKHINPTWNGIKIYPLEIITPNDLISIYYENNITYNGNDRINRTVTKRFRFGSINKKKYKIIINDTNKSTFSRSKIKKVLEEYNGVFVISTKDGKNVQENLDKWKNDENNPFDISVLEPFKLSEIKADYVKPTYKKRKATKTTFPAYKLNSKYYKYRSKSCNKYWEPVDVPFDDKNVYIEITDNVNKITDINKNELFTIANHYNIDIYGISSKDIHKLKNWIPINSFLNEKYNAYLKNKKLSIKDIYKIVENEKYSINVSLEGEYFIKNKNKLNKNSLFLKYINESEKCIQNIDEYKFILNIAKILNINIEKSAESKNITDMFLTYNKVINKYPLIKIINYYIHGNEDLNLFIDYINIVDKNLEN